LNKIFLTLLSILFLFNGCGYKANPYHDNSVVVSDKNVKFIIKKVTK